MMFPKIVVTVLELHLCLLYEKVLYKRNIISHVFLTFE